MWDLLVVNHLAHHEATFLISLGKLGPLSIIWTIALAFLGCWALIVSTFIYHFEQNDHHIILDVVTRVEIKLFVLNCITRYSSPVTLCCLLLGSTFWEPSGLIYSLVISFFGKLPTWTIICVIFNRHSFKYHVSMFPFMCTFKGKSFVISLSYHTYISFILSPLPSNITYPSWLATSYSCPSFIVLMWSYHWWSKYPFVLVPM